MGARATPATNAAEKARIEFTVHEYDHDPRAPAYVVGGISPLGQGRRLATFVDSSGPADCPVYVSAGRRGLELELSLADLLSLTEGRQVPIAWRS